MNTVQKLRALADSMGLDGYAESLREIAADLEKQQAAPAVPQGEPVAYLWKYIGKDAYPTQIHSKTDGYIARSIKEMDPKNPPYPDTWKPETPLYPPASLPATPPQEPVTQGEADSVQREIAAALALFPIDFASQTFCVSGFRNGRPLEADGDTEFFSKKKVIALLEKLHGHLIAALREKGQA